MPYLRAGLIGFTLLISCTSESTQGPDSEITHGPLELHLPPGCEEETKYQDPDCWLKNYTAEDWEAMRRMLGYINQDAAPICADAYWFFYNLYFDQPQMKMWEVDILDEDDNLITGEYHNWDRLELFSPRQQHPPILARSAVHEFLHGRWWDDRMCPDCGHDEIYSQAQQCTSL